jgi:hypothetical protein
VKRIKKCGLFVEEIELNINDIKSWMKKYPYLVDYYAKSGDVKIEKSIEHYLTRKYLNISKSDIVVDVESSGSPFSEILQKEAQWLWRDDRNTVPFSRHYSPESFVKKIISMMPNIRASLLFFKNLDKFSKYFHEQKVYCYFMFKGEKQ